MQKQNNTFIINNNNYLTIHSDLHWEDNICLSHKKSEIIGANKEETLLHIYFNRNILSYIFGYGFLNCLTNGVDSNYHFDKIVAFDENDDLIKIAKREYKYRFIKKKSKIVKRYYFSIYSVGNDVALDISMTYGFIDSDKDKYKEYTIPYFISINLQPKKVLSLIQFSTNPKIKDPIPW